MASDSHPDLPPPHSSSQPERIARSAGAAGAATLASRILGLARDQVLAASFGAGNDMDAFIVAFRMQSLVRDLFAEGAMSAAFVPTFTRHLTLQGKAAAWRLGNNILNALLVVTGAVVLLGYVFARPLVSAYAGSYASIPGKLELTIELTRVVLPFLTMAACAAAVMGMLNSLRYYFLPALAPAAFNLATIVCVLALAPVMPSLGLPRPMAIAIGALVGGLGQIAVQWPSLRREGFRYQPILNPRDPGLRQVLLLMGPGTLGLAATQVNVFVGTILATGQGTGAVSWLQYAFRLIYLPIGLVGVSIATAVLPMAARHAAVGDPRAIARTVGRGLGIMLAVNVPATVGLIVLSTDIVRLIFEHGQFLPSDTFATAAALRFYAVGLVGYSAARIASPVFYAIGRSRVAILLSTTSVTANLILSVILVRTLGFRGLALATSLAAVLNGGLSVYLLRNHFGAMAGRHLAATLAKTLIASLVMAVAATGAARGMLMWLPGEQLLLQAIRLFTAIALGLVMLAVSARLLRIPEFAELSDELRRRLRPRAAR